MKIVGFLGGSEMVMFDWWGSFMAFGMDATSSMGVVALLRFVYACVMTRSVRLSLLRKTGDKRRQTLAMAPRIEDGAWESLLCGERKRRPAQRRNCRRNYTWTKNAFTPSFSG
jgi:hypothetical protein